VIEPPKLPEEKLLTSATLDSSSASYGRHSGMPHSGSFSLVAQPASAAANASSSVENGGISVPSATRAAPGNAAMSAIKSGASSSASAIAAAGSTRPHASPLPT